jgi:hypothetical protein
MDNYLGAAVLVILGVLLCSMDTGFPTAGTPILALPLIVAGLAWTGLTLSSWAAVGQKVPLTVRARKNLNPGGVLPVALGVPVLAGAALFGPVFARRRNLAE